MKIGFVTKADANYFQGLQNLITSLRRTNPGIPITVLDCGLDHNQIKYIENRVERIVDLKVNHFSIKEIDTERFTNSIYAAMYLDKVEYDIIFQLDADLVVLDKLTDIFEQCAEKKFIGASDYPHISLKDQILNTEVIESISYLFPNINWDIKTFNGGVFCISRDFFINQIQPKTQTFSHLHLKLKTNDQALLNLAYASLGHDTFYDLGILYNFRPNFSRAPEIKLTHSCFSANKVLTGLYNHQTIKILHFIRNPKPWIDDFDKSSLAFKIWDQFSGAL